MTRTSIRNALVTLGAVFALAGCGGGGLKVIGTADVTTATASSGFDFPQQVRLDGGAGTVTGTCQISRSASGAYGVVVDLYGNSQAQGRAVRSMTIMGHSPAAPGQIDAELGPDTFTGTCNVITNVDESRGLVGLQATGCQISNAGETASVDVNLNLEGCTVIAN